MSYYALMDGKTLLHIRRTELVLAQELSPGDVIRCEGEYYICCGIVPREGLMYIDDVRGFVLEFYQDEEIELVVLEQDVPTKGEI